MPKRNSTKNFKYFLNQKVYEYFMKARLLNEEYDLLAKARRDLFFVLNLVWTGVVIGSGLWLLTLSFVWKGIGFMLLFTAGIALISDLIKKLKWHFN